MTKNRTLRRAIQITIITIVMLLGLANRTSAATVFNTDVTAPTSGNIFVSVNGTYTTASADQIVKRINEIRKEACNQGVINPATGKKLTAADYKPVTWNETLETYARLRAAEASVNWAHTRPNAQSTFKNTVKISGGYHSGENLALGYTILQSIEGYYSEKKAYVNKTGGQTGHYTAMINPKNTLVGVGAFQQAGAATYSAMEFGTLLSSGTNSTKKNTFSGAATQIVEVNVAYLVNSVTISGTKNIAINQKVKLTATANMKNATKSATITQGATWTSSNTKVATVDKNGNVTGKAAGTATIKVNVGGKVASYAVTVKKVNATSVKLSATSKSLVKGGTFTLTATVSPTNASNKKVTYKSSNTNVATVDANGKVTAKAAGTATITATTADGTKKTATCKVTVTNPVKVTSVKLNATTKTLKVKETFTLKATIAPTNATNKNVTYKSSNTNIATVDANGKVTAKAAGTVTITVTTKDGSKTSTCKITVKK